MVNKFSNTKAYMNNFSKKLVKALRLELKNAKQRQSKYGSFTAPIESSGSLANSIMSMYKANPDGFSFNIEGNSYGKVLDEGSDVGIPDVRVADIADWIRRKPVMLRDLKTGSVISGVPESRVQSLANVITKKIQARGVYKASFISEALNKMVNQLDDIGNPIVEDINLNIEEILIKSGYVKKGDNFII
jgi:hypothetical protein